MTGGRRRESGVRSQNARVAATLMFGLVLTGCSSVKRDPPIQVWWDMKWQDKFKTQFSIDVLDKHDELAKIFPDHRQLRRPPEGTIARGFLHTPRVLFLDEPTLGLDPQSRNQMWTHVKSLNETDQVTVFLTTHYMDEADRVAQRIAIIDHGRVTPGNQSGRNAPHRHH